MPGANQLTCLTLGIGSHGRKCCPHVIWGIRITGSPNTSTNNKFFVSTHSIGVHNSLIVL